MYTPEYKKIEETTKTPAYVFDTDVLNARIKIIKETLGENIHICYAMKANPFVTGEIKDTIDRYEVCSPGEFKICERAKVPMNKIVLSGVYKETEDTKRIVATYKDDIVYTCESVNQFHLINEAAVENKIKVNVLLRVTTGNQFGIDEPELCELVKHREDYHGVAIKGIQHFSGTQRKKIKRYQEELAYADALITKLKNEYDYEAEELEFGPGFYVEYFKDAKPYDEIELMKQFKELLDHLDFKGQITLELGRFIAATCGSYYTKIVDMKQNHDITWCIINGGMHQLNYFGQMMAMKIPYYRHLKKKNGSGIEAKCNISGSLCTVNDNIVKSLPLQVPEIGDILEFQNTGAYCMYEGISLFLSRDLPKVYLYSEKEGLTLMRDTFETNVLNYKSIGGK